MTTKTIEELKQEFEYFTMTQTPDDEEYVDVYGWGTWEETSVLAGQAKKSFIESITPEKALEKYPNIQYSNKWVEPVISLNHLSDGPDY